MRKNRFKNRPFQKRKDFFTKAATLFKILSCAAIVVLISFFFIFSHDFITQCEYFDIEKINITGADILPKKTILQQAGLDFNKKDKINILSISLSMVRKRLLAHPMIEDAGVKRELPGTVNITVKEQKPLAVIDLGKKFVINKKGEIFKELSSKDPLLLPVITGLEFSDLNADSRTTGIPFKAVMNVLHLGQKSESPIPNSSLKMIIVDRETGITLHTINSIKTIKLGYNNFSDKYKRFKNILYYIKEKNDFSNIISIDLNNPDRVVANAVKIESSAVKKTLNKREI